MLNHWTIDIVFRIKVLLKIKLKIKLVNIYLLVLINDMAS